MFKFRILYLIAISVLSILISCKDDDGPYGGDKAQYGSIMGVITDYATGEPVPNANVQLRPGGETTLTGYDGRYEFLDIQDGKYSITVSKAEYGELIDDYIIEVKSGKRMRRDVQIRKLPTSIRIIDMYGSDISTLDYGSDASTVTKSFNIFNNGTVPIKCQMVYTCNWISEISSIPSSIASGETVAVIVRIDRTLLPAGQNSSVLTIATNNGSAEIVVKASSTSGNPPDVRMSQVNNNSITPSSVSLQGYVQDARGGEITDCGFCYSTSSNPSLDDRVVRIGPQTGSFSYTITNLEAGTTYHCRAFATSNLGTGYSTDIIFTTASGLAECGKTTVTILDTSTASGESTAKATSGCSILEKGLCWSMTHNPTVNDHKAEAGFGDGRIYTHMTSLQANTKYWVRSYAISEYGTSYGPENVFTSGTGMATVVTEAPILSGDEIITGGTVTDNGGTAIYERGVCYGSSPNPDISSVFEHTYDGYETGSYVSRIPKPSRSGYLYIRAFVTTKYGTSYGNQVSIYIN